MSDIFKEEIEKLVKDSREILGNLLTALNNLSRLEYIVREVLWEKIEQQHIAISKQHLELIGIWHRLETLKEGT